MDLILEKTVKRFGSKTALDIDYYNIHSGEIIGLLGNNGAGKTTMFRIILDLLHADSGNVIISGSHASSSAYFNASSFNDEAVNQSSLTSTATYITSQTEEWKKHTGAFVDTGFLIDYLTPEEYFRFITRLHGISETTMNARLVQFDTFMNGEILGQKKLIRNLSAGNKQKVGIIGAMLHYPRLLMLDEPFNFLDPSSQIAMKYLLENYNKATGATIIVSSHNLSHTFDICTRVTLLEHGKIIKDYDKEYAELNDEIEEYFKGVITDKIQES